MIHALTALYDHISNSIFSYTHMITHVKLSVYMYTGDNDTDSVASGRLIAVTKNYCHLTYRAHPRLIHTLLASVLLALSLSGCGILFDSLVRAA